MDALRTLLEQQPLLALVLTIALGYMAGEIQIKGFSLGVGAVLFVALAIGWFAPKAAPRCSGRSGSRSSCIRSASSAERRSSRACRAPTG